MAGSITQEDREFVESWEHISPQQWGIIRLDPRGDERPEIIEGRKTFKITTEERILTQDKVRDEANDPFLNGSFRPVIVPDSVTIESNPNALSDEEITKILSASDVAWEEWLKTITSVATLRRMIEIAESVDLGLKRYRTLEARLVEVRGKVQISTNDPALKNFLTDRPNPNAGSNPAADDGTPRRQGGRSSDYRPAN
jgi:hypothetical protein